MTATPIPRTVAMTVFGDMETSTLRELPARPVADRHPRRARGQRRGWVQRTWERIAEEVRAGRQAYVVCPRIGDGDRRRHRGAADDEEIRCPRADRTSDGEDGEAAAAPRELASVYAVEAEPARGARARRARHRGAARSDGARGQGRGDGAVHRGATSTCWSRPRSSRSASTSPTRRSWSSWTPTGSASPSCTSCAGGSAAAARRALPAHDQHRGRGVGRARLEAVAATTDGFELARLDLEQRARVTSSARGGSPVGRNQLEFGSVGAARRGGDRGRAGGRRRSSSPRTPTSPTTPTSPRCSPSGSTRSRPPSSTAAEATTREPPAAPCRRAAPYARVAMLLSHDDEGTGSAVVLLHAGVADRRMWDDVTPALAHSFRVIRPDLRGFGQTPMPPGAYADADDVTPCSTSSASSTRRWSAARSVDGWPWSWPRCTRRGCRRWC